MSVESDLQAVVEVMVDDRVEVDIRTLDEFEPPLIEMTVADGDIGKVIGRQGRTARALRRLLTARGERRGRTWELKIVEE